MLQVNINIHMHKHTHRGNWSALSLDHGRNRKSNHFHKETDIYDYIKIFKFYGKGLSKQNKNKLYRNNCQRDIFANTYNKGFIAQYTRAP